MVVEQNFQTDCTTDNAHSKHTSDRQHCFEVDCAKCRFKDSSHPGKATGVKVTLCAIYILTNEHNTT